MEALKYLNKEPANEYLPRKRIINPHQKMKIKPKDKHVEKAPTYK